MTTTIHRQIGRMGKRSADDASVAMLIKEVDETGILLGKLSEHTKAWRDAWTSILVDQTRLDDSFHDCYSTIPRTGDTALPPLETDVSIMKRVATLHATHNDLKTDMLEEVDKIDRLVLGPLMECRNALKPIKKQIDRRENKKLDYERFNKQVEHAKKKAAKSDREYAVQSKAEIDLEKATTAYEIADNHLKEVLPPLIERIVGFLPLLVELYARIQFTLCQHSYSALYGFTGDYGYTDEDMPAIIAAWETAFLPVQQEVESDIRMIAKGKAVTLPMNYVAPDKTASIPRVNLPGRSKKPPPPPPADNGAVDRSPVRGRESYERPPVLGRNRSPSFQEDFERNESPPPVPGSRPIIGGLKGRVSQPPLRADRDESPPPPLPGPRPQIRPTSSSNGGDGASIRSRPSFSSYASGTGSGVTATPLAGLSPSALSAASQRPEVKRIGSSYANEKSQTLHSGSNGDSKGPQEPTSVAARIRSLSFNSANDNRPPLYSATSSRSVSTASILGAAAGKKKPPPPPPKKKIGGPKGIWVRALFTFDGQDAGDLSFAEGDRIRVTKKTPSTDDWWEGEVDGRVGSFPANYCEPTT